MHGKFTEDVASLPVRWAWCSGAHSKCQFLTHGNVLGYCNALD